MFSHPCSLCFLLRFSPLSLTYFPQTRWGPLCCAAATSTAARLWKQLVNHTKSVILKVLGFYVTSEGLCCTSEWKPNRQVKPHIAVTRYTTWNLDQKQTTAWGQHWRPGQPILDMSRPATDNRSHQAILSILVTLPLPAGLEFMHHSSRVR